MNGEFEKGSLYFFKISRQSVKTSLQSSVSIHFVCVPFEIVVELFEIVYTKSSLNYAVSCLWSFLIILLLKLSVYYR